MAERNPAIQANAAAQLDGRLLAGLGEKVVVD